MNWPFLVLPYQGSPWRWKTLVSRLTHTMPGDGGTWATTGPEAAVAVGAVAGREAGAAAGAAEAAPTVTIGVMVAMVFAGTPARERSCTEEYGRPAMIFFAVAAPTP